MGISQLHACKHLLFLAMLLSLCSSCGSATDGNGSQYDTAVSNAAKYDFSISGDATLRERATAKGFLYGGATFKRALNDDPQFAAAFAKECNILVPEWELKWHILRPTPTTYDFSASDRLLSYAQANNILFRGHTLVWHESLPSWFTDYATPENAEQLLREHIQTVAGRYAGKIHSWDVVNEAIAPWENDPEGLRTSSPWYQLLGPQYIEIAFRAAAEADPSAILVYNEAGLEPDTIEADTRRADVLNLLRNLKNKGVPVHALGIQGHLKPNKAFSAAKFKDFLGQVSSLGLKILITEMDVTDSDLPADQSERDSIIAGLYYDFLSAALQEPAVIGVMTWGLSDKYSWIDRYYPRQDNLPSRPLPLDENMERKMAWNAAAKAFDEISFIRQY